MSRSTLLLIFFLSLAAVALGFNYFLKPFASTNLANQVSDLVEEEPSPSPLSPTEQIISKLSAKEKVAQLLAAPLVIDDDLIETINQENQASPSAQWQWVIDHNPGLVTLFGERVGTDSATTVTSAIPVKPVFQSLALNPLVAVDHEGGTVQRLSGTGFTRLPSWQVLCQGEGLDATASADLVTSSAIELSSVGIDIVFSPVLDMAQNHPVLRTRVCSSEAEVVLNQSARWVQIFQSQGVLPVIKHFPGIGQTTLDLHKSFDRVQVGSNQALLYRTILEVFPNLGVMISHVGVTNQFADVPCSLSPTCVSELADNFNQILVFSDALDMEAAKGPVEVEDEKSLSQIALEAVMAGNHFLVFGPTVSPQDLSEVVDELVKSYNQDQLVKEKIDSSLKKIIDYKLSRVIN